ncbi:MAG: hypothetical protein ACT6FF_05325 [Methanosarcinaceae archaeon]
MRKLCIKFLLILFFATQLLGNDLTDIYKTGKLILEPDSAFARNNDWDSLFGSTSERRYKNIAVAADGSVFLLAGNEIYKFNKNGDFLLKFSDGGRHSSKLEGACYSIDVVNTKFVVVTQYSQLHLFNINGKFIRTIKRDYTLRKCIFLNTKKIAVSAWVGYSGNRAKNHVAVLDIETEKEIPVTHFMETYKNTTISYKFGKGSMMVSNSFRRFRVYIDKTPAGNLVVGYSENPDIVIYSPQGKEISRFQLNYPPILITQQEKDEYYQRMDANDKLPDSALAVIKHPAYFPKNKPYYYDLKVDSDGNILVFKNVKDENHIFQVYQAYSKEGHFICETTIEPKLYQNPRTKLLTFHQGALFGLVKLRESHGSKFRLLKVNLLDLK